MPAPPGCDSFSCAVVFHGQLRDLSQTEHIWSKGPGVFLPVSPKHLPAQALLLCLVGTAASAACCSAPKLAQGVAKLALLGVECFLTCCLPHIYIYFKLFQKQANKFMLLPRSKITVLKALVALPCIWDWRNGWETELQVCFGLPVKISKRSSAET